MKDSLPLASLPGISFFTPLKVLFFSS